MSLLSERQQNDLFEEEVRIIAKNLFPSRGSNVSRNALDRERDGLFDDGETFHIFEVTVSRKLQKIQDDIRKSVSLVSELRRLHPEHNVKIWIVTKEPPTADQEDEARAGRKKARCPVEILSYSELYNKLFDAKFFLDARKNYPFGSVRDPITNSYRISNNSYVSVGFTHVQSSAYVSPMELSNAVRNGGFRAVVVGDYGAGKSMALRHMYHQSSDAFLAGQTRRFPIYLNLRDHFGQNDPAEALVRHAGKLGIDFNRLIAAWRSGFADLYLDGFDELSPVQFATELRNLRFARRAAAELVAKFIEESSPNS